jgi:hypothetical protein
LKATAIIPQFVEFIPSTLQDGVLYISQKYGTAVHKCCCGCGIKIVTPITPTDWKLKVSGDDVTLHPSIGNWNHPCQSHYIIRRNRVIWVGSMTQQEINLGRKRDRDIKKQYYGKSENINNHTEPRETLQDSTQIQPKKNFLKTIKHWLKSMFC